jgi:hypothetical protein
MRGMNTLASAFMLPLIGVATPPILHGQIR